MKLRFTFFLTVAAASAVCSSLAEGPAQPPDQVVVVGDVRNPGALVYTADLTIMSAVNAQGGEGPFFHGQFYLIRGGVRTLVDRIAILRKPETDIPLKPWDIVYVFDPFRSRPPQ